MRTGSNVQSRRSNGSSNIEPQDIQLHNEDQRSSLHSNSSHNLNFTQQQINAALFNSNSPSYSVQPMFNGKHYQNHELHMAEILVETNGQQRSAFQFDTITPKKKSPTARYTPNNVTSDYNDAPLSSVMLDSGIEISQASISNDENSTKENADIASTASSGKNAIEESCVSTVKSESSSSDDNGGFVTPEDQERSKSLRVKRATVVGNPMFSRSQDSELGETGESLGLDDLEMDYDQIMNYFDNLKVNMN